MRLESVEFKSTEIIPDIDQYEKYKALYTCISSLEESDQSIMVLYLENLPYKRIADMTENHVAMKRIRKKLLNCITSKLN
jgi:RNA polymerase sigma-70 factor (ECF subfamily)